MDLSSYQVIERSAEVMIFFNKPLNKVNKILLSYAMTYEPPDWMRGKTSLNDLPRHDKKISTHTISADDFTVDQLGRCCVWIVEQLNGKWSISEQGFSFENENEAVLFKLVCS